MHKPYVKNDSYTFKRNEILLNKPTYLGFVLLEVSKLVMYET